jgi:hypothetical protein
VRYDVKADGLNGFCIGFNPTNLKKENGIKMEMRFFAFFAFFKRVLIPYFCNGVMAENQGAATLILMTFGIMTHGICTQRNSIIIFC